MVGKRVAHYKILEKLGEGGMGLVYKARDTHLDRFVAIMVLPRERVADPSRKARFVHEARAASALNHPNIVHIYDISSDAGQDFIAMEYVAGKTLGQWITHLHHQRLRAPVVISGLVHQHGNRRGRRILRARKCRRA